MKREIPDTLEGCCDKGIGFHGGCRRCVFCLMKQGVAKACKHGCSESHEALQRLDIIKIALGVPNDDESKR